MLHKSQLILVIIAFKLLLPEGFFQLEQGHNKQVTLTGKVIAITDGDTFKLLTKDSVTHKIRLASIDCPERKQPFSTKAKSFVSDAIFGKEVTVKTQGKDRYGRYIGWVYYDDSKILNEELLKSGLAWHYHKYSKDQNLQKMEDHARVQKLGLWADKTPIPPWEWRN